MDDTRIPISNTLVQALGDYLISRPYREVAMLIGALQSEVQASAATKPNMASGAVLNGEISTTSVGEIQ